MSVDYVGSFLVSASCVITAYPIPAASGLSGSMTIKSSKNGGSFNTITPSVTDISNGFYSLALSATDTNTAGDLVIQITNTGNDPYAARLNVVGYNPADSVRLGLTALPTAIIGASGALIIAATTAGDLLLDSSGGVRVDNWAGAATATTNAALSATPISANVTQWAGFTTSTTQSAIATTPAVNAIQWAGFSTATTQSAIATTPSVNVINWAGAATATTQSAIATTPAVNAIQWAGFSTATTQVAVATGVSVSSVNVTQWAGFNTATTQIAIATAVSAGNVNVTSWAGFNTATTQVAIATTPIPASVATSVSVQVISTIVDVL